MECGGNESCVLADPTVVGMQGVGLIEINIAIRGIAQDGLVFRQEHPMNSIEPVMPWSLGPNYPHWSEQLRDGTRITIRPVTKADADRERAFIETLSPQARRFRCLGQIARPSAELIARFTDIDYQHDVAFAAVEAGQAEETFLGVSRYDTTQDGTSCECAVTVLDAWHHKGLGTLLMKHLIEVAKARGILCMFSIDAIDNTDMAELAKHLGFTRHPDRNDARQVVHSLWLQP
jgi:GNAT superfamily N-acetyltransferase